MSVTLLLARHGETYANKRGILQGQMVFTDDTGDLTDKGHKDAQRVSGFISDFETRHAVSVTHGFTSDLPRALQTCAIVAGNREFVPTTDLRERGLGRAEGTKKVIGRRSTFPGKEETKAFQSRIRSFLTSVESQEGGSLVVAVTHGGFIRGLCNVLRLNIPSDKQSVANGHVCAGTFDLATKQWQFLENGWGL